MLLLDLHGGNARVVMVVGKHCRIQTVTEHCVEAMLRGKLFNDPEFVLAVGDVVTADSYGDHWMIETVAPRHNEFVREGLRKQRQVLFANIDRVLILASGQNPQTKSAAIDRFLVAALRGGVTPALVITKTDLDENHQREKELRALYDAFAMDMFSVSNVTGEGIASLRDFTQHGITALIGNSGVGKTSLLNQLQPGLDLRVREVSSWSGKGTHTTSAAVMIPFGEHAAIIDTPGMKSFVPFGISRENLTELFPDIEGLASQCRFHNCGHQSEPECAVQAALTSDELPASRWRSFRRLWDELP